MFKIGFRSYATKEDLEMAKRIGMEVIELMWEEKTWERKDEIKSLLKDYGIKASAMPHSHYWAWSSMESSPISSTLT